jgi:hypothetical protein
VPIDDDLALFDFIDVEKVKAEAASMDDEFFDLRHQRLDILDWLEQEDLPNPLGRLQSAYGTRSGDEKLRFTNVTSDFVGHLDYVFHDSSFRVKQRLWVPTSFEELEDNTGVRNGHILPSNVWPSDHLAIGAMFSLLNPAATESSKLSQNGTKPATASLETSSSDSGKKIDEMQFCLPANGSPTFPMPVPGMPVLPTSQHGQRCACGCVPNVLSLFEMAELRKKARAAGRK